MGKTQNFFEYQQMLADEYAGLDPKRLLRLYSVLAERGLTNAAEALASSKYAGYKEMFHLTYNVIQCGGEEVDGPVIDQCQRDLSAAYSKFSRKSKLSDERKDLLSVCTAQFLQMIYYLKTEDPLYLLGLLEEIQKLDAATLLKYEDQLVLLKRLKSFLKI